MKKGRKNMLEEREQEYEYIQDREAWRAAIHGVAKSRTRMSDWTETWMLKLDKDQASRSKVNHPEVEKDWYAQGTEKRVI